MDDVLKLIVGLGNPGPEHERDRHNVGYWLVDDLVSGGAPGFRNEQKILGDACQVMLGSRNVRLLKPMTFMNRSGQSVRQAIDYYKLSPEQVLVIHDDLDLLPGTARFKRGGGHGGHNGLRDIISHCGKDFLRLRIGIGHPGRREQVTGFVLRPPGKEEHQAILNALGESRRALDVLMADGLEKATHCLHTATPREDMGNNLGSAG
jgi:PTH1 family peptidyl-tRNA hydrolase